MANDPEDRTESAAPDVSDVVKQVRTVHVSLVATSFLVLVSWLYSSPSAVTRALAQLRRIDAVLEAWGEVCVPALQAWTPEGLWLPRGYFEFEGHAYEVNATVKWGRVFAPETLAEFRGVWDALRAVRYPTAPIGGANIKITRERAGLAPARAPLLAGRPAPEKAREPSPVDFVYTLQIYPSLVRMYGEFEPEREMGSFECLEGGSGRAVQGHICDLAAPIGRANFQPVLVRALRAHGVAFPLGQFAAVFADLNTLTSIYQHRAFYEIKEQLERERGSVDDRLEVLGARIPAGAIATWGPLLIMVLQLYFHVHARRLFGLIRSRQSIDELAWVGLYGLGLARVLLVFSAILLPVVVVAWLGARSILSPTDGGAVLASLVAVPGSLMIGRVTDRLIRSAAPGRSA